MFSPSFEPMAYSFVDASNFSEDDLHAKVFKEKNKFVKILYGGNGLLKFLNLLVTPLSLEMLERINYYS